MEFIQRSIIHHGLVTRQLMTSGGNGPLFLGVWKSRNPEPETETEPEPEPELEPEPKK